MSEKPMQPSKTVTDYTVLKNMEPGRPWVEFEGGGLTLDDARLRAAFLRKEYRTSEFCVAKRTVQTVYEVID